MRQANRKPLMTSCPCWRFDCKSFLISGRFFSSVKKVDLELLFSAFQFTGTLTLEARCGTNRHPVTNAKLFQRHSLCCAAFYARKGSAMEGQTRINSNFVIQHAKEKEGKKGKTIAILTDMARKKQTTTNRQPRPKRSFNSRQLL